MDTDPPEQRKNTQSLHPRAAPLALLAIGLAIGAFVFFDTEREGERAPRERIFYGYDQSPEAISKNKLDCESKGGTLNTCASQCPENFEGGCPAVCVVVCEFENHVEPVDISSWRVYQNSAKGFEILFPSDWMVSDDYVEPVLLIASSFRYPEHRNGLSFPPLGGMSVGVYGGGYSGVCRRIVL